MNVNEVQLKSMHESENMQDIFINTLSFFTWKNSIEQEQISSGDLLLEMCTLEHTSISS